jgi:DNA-binding IclR family transcriptional regulator
MSDFDREIIRTIATNGGAVSLVELMSLVNAPDADVKDAVIGLHAQGLVRMSDESAPDPLITVREKALKVA